MRRLTKYIYVRFQIWICLLRFARLRTRARYSCHAFFHVPSSINPEHWFLARHQNSRNARRCVAILVFSVLLLLQSAHCPQSEGDSVSVSYACREILARPYMHKEMMSCLNSCRIVPVNLLK